jgi:hypothetical protein
MSFHVLIIFHQSLRLEEYDLGFFYDHQKYTAHVRQNWMYLLPPSVPLEQAAEMAKITQPSFLFARLEVYLFLLVRFFGWIKISVLVILNFSCVMPMRTRLC